MSRNSGGRFRGLHIRGDHTGETGADFDSFTRLWAAGTKATAPLGRDGTTRGRADGGVPINSFCEFGVLEEVLDLGGAASVTSTQNLLPANSLIDVIVCTPVRDFTTPVTYNIGDVTTTTRFATGLANDTVAEGPAYATAHLTGTVAFRQVSAAKVRVVPNAAGQGLLHVAVYFRRFVGGQAK